MQEKWFTLKRMMVELPKEIKKIIKVEIIIVLLTVLVTNPFGSAVIASINSQEIITYHIRDALVNMSSEPESNHEYYLATGTYERQLEEEGKEQLFGIAKNRNLVIVQMESFQNMVINAEYEGQELTPEINKLIEEPGTLYFDNYYQQIGTGNTSDAELASNNSLIGTVESYSYQLFEDNYFKGMPWLLKEKGYNTNVFHGYDKKFWNRTNIYPALGIDRFYCDEDFESDNIKGIGAGNITGISDHAFFEQATDYMTQLKEPYYSMLITLSSHNPFGLPKKLSKIKLEPEYDNLVGRYFDSINYSDRCIGEFLQLMKEKDLYENSIIVFYGDHFAMPKADGNVDKLISKWLGHEYTYDKMMNIPLIIHIPGYEKNETISTSGGQTDLMATLAYLMGFETLDTIYLGQNLLTAQQGFVPMQTHMLKGSFIKDDVVFEMARNGIFADSRAYNRLTREPIDISDYEEDYKRAKATVEMSSFYLYNDVLRLALKEGKGFEDIVKEIRGEVKIESKLERVYIKRFDKEVLFDFYDEMKKYPKKQVVVASDDLEGLLFDFDTMFSGKKAEVGLVNIIDQKSNREYIQIKSRIIPEVDSKTSFAKIEYLGYGAIFVKPSLDAYSKEEIQKYMEINNPAGIMLSMDECRKEFHGLLQQGIPVYAYDLNSESEQAFLKAIGVDGIVN